MTVLFIAMIFSTDLHWTGLVVTWMTLLSMSLAWKRMASKCAREGRRVRSAVT